MLCTRDGRLGTRAELAPTAHHLQVLGAAASGKVGSKLIRFGIERAEKAGVPCYLESSNVKNISFYKRHGFEVIEELYLFEDKATGERPPCYINDSSSKS